MGHGQRRLVGRDRELAVIERVLGRGPEEDRALLLRGSAGIGKTSLLRAARERAGALGFRILSTTGSEVETSFAFAGLQPLLLPLIDQDAVLPAHLRTALRSALGQLDEPIAALATVALGLLGLLSAAAKESSPLCLVVDDVHWLDASSAEVLRFVAGRLAAEPVVVIAAGREGGVLPAGALPELKVEPLGPEAAAAVLDANASELTPATRARVMAEARGNPLALVELPRALTATLSDPSRVVPRVLPLTARLEQAFTRQFDLLAPDSKDVLLVAALAPAASLADLLAAAGELAGHEVGLSALDDATFSELVEADDRHLHFRHPLIRSGLLHATFGTRRRAAHEALSRVLADGERRLYHRAEACVGYDDQLADELEEAAGAASRRGSPGSAVAALEQAAALTAPGRRRESRLVRAAALSFEVGDTDRARHLLGRSGAAEPGGAARLAVEDRSLAHFLAAATAGSDADDPRPVWDLITVAGQAVAAGDHDGALRLLEFASSRVSWDEQGRELGRAVVATAQLTPDAGTDPRVTALIAQSMPVEGHLQLTARLARVDEETLAGTESQRLVGFAAVLAGDYDRAERLLQRVERELRRQARLAPLAAVLTFRGVSTLARGEWRLAAEILDEAERLAAETDQPPWLTRARQLRAGLAGMSGDEEQHRRIVDEQTLTYQRMQAHHRTFHLTVMMGKTAAVRGRADDAVELLGGLFDPADPHFDARGAYEVVYYLADAASAKDRPDVVHRMIEVLAAAVPAPWPPILQSGIDYARAVAAGDPMKQELFESALKGPASGRPFDRARIQLAYGSWLRRQRRRSAARELLREARGTFERLGNEPFAQRARDELRATGEGSPRRRGTELEKLSAQELQIARLVAEGLPNKEIAERLFLSHRTVGYHLYRMFPKLGITTRTQLAAVAREM